MRTDNEILRDLMDAVMVYNADRDAEWDFVDAHGLDNAMWSGDEVKEHQQILDDIQKNRDYIRSLLREATGDDTIEF